MKPVNDNIASLAQKANAEIQAVTHIKHIPIIRQNLQAAQSTLSVDEHIGVDAE